MITEIFNLLSSMDVTKNGFNKKFGKDINVNLGNSKIRSISAFSSNSIFYFPIITSNQITPEESTMIKRMIEKSAASFVVACISLMPFHRISSDDRNSIEDYLSQFHQNLGIGQGSTQMINKLVSMNLTESVEISDDLKDTQDFLVKCWDLSKSQDQDFLKIVSETVSLNDMYKVDPIDPKTKVLQTRYNEVQSELATWGFIGEATDDMTYDQLSDSDLEDFTDYDDDDDEDYESMSDEELMNNEYMDISDEDIEAEFPGLSALLDEKALTANARKELPDDVFGIPKKRAFPLNDARHVEQAIRMFSHADESERAGLAKKIFTAVDKFNVDVKIGKDNPLYDYAPKSLQESILGDYVHQAVAGLKNVTHKPAMNTGDFTRLKKNLTNLVNKTSTTAGIEALRSDANAGIKQLTTYSNNLKKVEKNSTDINDGTKAVLTKRMKDGVSSKKVEEYIDWLKNDYKAMLTKRAAEIKGGISESAVKSAIDNIKFSLESVSENKILSASSLTKLSSLEAKLNKLKNKYTKYLNRYKRKYKENQKSGSKAKLAIRFNNMTIDDPKVFMQQYGSYIKIINQRLKAVAKRKAELLKRKGKESQKIEESITSVDFDTLDYCISKIDESVNAPDSEVFILTEGKNDIRDLQQRLADQEARLQGKNQEVNYQQRKNDSLTKEAQKNSFRAEKAEKSRDLYKRGYDRLKNQQPTGGTSDSSSSKSTSTSAKYLDGKTFDREVFTNMDLKKANEAVPTFAKVTINFIVDDTNEVVARDFLVGVKGYIHTAPSMELIDDIYNSIINKRKLLRFVKFITGEEKSLADLMFGIKELRSDAIDAKTDHGEWRSAFKRRKRWSKISIPFLMKEYTPNGTIVMTMNEVEFIKDQYGIDVMTPDHINMIMEADFLLSFVVVDQANEIVYVTYDGHNGITEQYTYASLERESQSSDRMMRELYRSFSR